MTRCLLVLLALLPSFASGQQYGLEVEVVTDNIGVLSGLLGVTDLTGYATVRLYVTTVNPDDFVGSISGSAENPTYVNTTTDFFHSIVGAGVPNGINSLLFS